MRKKIVVITLSVVTILAVVTYFVYPRMEARYQRWADCRRINDIYYIAHLIEEFKIKNGHYPLGAGYLEPEEEELAHVPVMVNITHRDLPEQYQSLPGGMSGRLASTSELTEELRKGLERKIDVPSDPQNVPTHAPNFYQYLLFPDGYYILTAYLYNPSDFTTKIGEHYFKYSVGSVEKVSETNHVLNFNKLGVKPQKCTR